MVFKWAVEHFLLGTDQKTGTILDIFLKKFLIDELVTEKHLRSQRGQGKITQRLVTIGTSTALGRRSQSTLRAVALCCQVLAVPAWLWAQEPESLLLRALLPRQPPAPHPIPWLLLPLVHCCKSSRNQTSATTIPPNP